MRKQKYKKLPKTLKKFFKRESDGSYSKRESKVERETRLILDSLGFPYHQEFNIKYKKHNKFYDFFVFSEDKTIAFIVECHSYWHYPDRLPDYQKLIEIQNEKSGKKKRVKKKPTKTQKKNMRNDKLKEKMAKVLGIPLIVVWEHELENYPKVAIKRIKEEWLRQENSQI